MMPNNTEKSVEEHRIELLKIALRQCYSLAWNIERESHNAGTKMRALEIKRTAMSALQQDQNQ